MHHRSNRRRSRGRWGVTGAETHRRFHAGIFLLERTVLTLIGLVVCAVECVEQVWWNTFAWLMP